MNHVSAFIRDVMICIVCGAILATLWSFSKGDAPISFEITNPLEVKIVKGAK